MSEVAIIEKEWVTPREAAVILGISSVRIYQLIQNNRVEWYKTDDGSYLVTRDSLEEYRGVRDTWNRLHSPKEAVTSDVA